MTSETAQTNLPSSEWTRKIPDARLCKGLAQLTDQAHIIEARTES